MKQGTIIDATLIDEAEGNGEKSLQDACARRLGKPVHGSPCATGADLNKGLVCLFGQIRANRRGKGLKIRSTLTRSALRTQ
jgi:hypothetical protein